MIDVVHLANGEFLRPYLQGVPQDVACFPIDLRREGKQFQGQWNNSCPPRAPVLVVAGALLWVVQTAA